ncbi:MAG TPA: MFS transporter [Gemmataceae bacterium]|nr:MFS transporter [Gemmataceae bacterium]
MPDSDTPLTQDPEIAAAPPATAPADRARRSALFIVFLVVVIDLLGFGIVLPLLALYANRLLLPIFPGDEGRLARGGLLAALMASFSFMQFLFAPVWGRISDRVGRRPILLLGLGGSAAFYALFAYASHLGFTGQPALAVGLILIARVGAGVAGATIATAQAVVADCTPPERRARGMALIGAAFGIGFTFGPLLAYASFFVPSRAAPGVAAAGLSLIALLLGVVLLPETLRAGVAAGRRHWFRLGATLEVLRTPVIGALVAIFFLATVAFGSLESTLALMNQLLLSAGQAPRMDQLTDDQLEEVFKKSSLIFAYVGLVLMVIQGGVYRRCVGRVGEVRFLRMGTALMLLGLGCVIVTVLGVTRGNLAGQGTVIPLALIILAVLVTGFALMTPSIQALISRRADPTRQGEILGVNQSMSALARILGPAIGPFLFFADSSHVLPYVVGAGLMAVVFMLTLRLHQG